MKLLTLVSVILASTVCVHGGAYRNENPSWMLFPGADGVPRLAILRGPVGHTPKAIDPVNDVKFYLYTRSNRNNPTQIFVNDLQGGPFDGSQNTKFIAHGFTGSGFDSWVTDMKNSFLDQENCNVIAVDWSGPAAGPLYNVARGNVRDVGEYVGQMHSFLNNQGGAPGRTHCIGHSLGAHVCGFSGKVTRNLGRITGMDPAMPLFDINTPSERLSSGDANYVDIIHTCGAQLGFESSLGHADFFPNGGKAAQPGCGNDLTGNCSHGRSHEFFIESIKTSNFRARQCASWDNFQSGSCNGNTVGIMGDNSDTGTRGDFYLATSDSSPYALG